jgi:Rad3-related DNA helicase
MVFFPSYKYMNEVYNHFKVMYPTMECIIQDSIMNEEEREKFLNQFKESPENTMIGFCVLGGLFSEGIDLKKDRLIGAIIVGVGLPQICLERNIIRNFFEEDESLGYEYAYMYPGMNKVLQAAGRVIRSEEDKGIIVLLDDRFLQKKYLELFPREWFSFASIRNKDDIIKNIDQFWSKHCLK